jgi:regulatory protein
MAKKITALKVQKKNPERLNIYLDGEFAFGLSRIVAAWLSIGQELDQSQVDSLLAKDEIEVAYQRALKFLSYKARSAHEVQQKLSQVGFSEEVINIVVDRLLTKEYLDDKKFAELWVENRSAFRPRSYRVLSWELKQKKISEDIIQDVLQNADAEINLAEAAAQKYLRRLENLDYETFQKKMSGFLARRGFSYSIVKQVVKKLWEEKTYEKNG